ncbi:hypothetical protein X738_26925 [Mesorhizobium sp. LNHC209A00]|nr:hypothetical protein X738_26925 [Mesorhizobium sp. LNHC209A00]
MRPKPSTRNVRFCAEVWSPRGDIFYPSVTKGFTAQFGQSTSAFRRSFRETTFAIATCEPNDLMATIHDRMAVILEPADYMRGLVESRIRAT